MPAASRKLRGIKWPEVLDGEPKLRVRPFRSASERIAGLVLMKTDRNCSSSTRCTSGTTLPPERWLACTKVKPPSQARSTCLLASASTAAA